MHDNFNILNSKLINHYQCFNSERFWLDEVNEDYVSVVSSIEDECPFTLCRNIATYILKAVRKMEMSIKFIYVGAWAFNAEKMEA